MKSNTHKTQILKRTCLAMSGALFLAGSIGTTYQFTQASAAQYSTTGDSVTLDGENDGSATVVLKTSVARTYVAIQGTWSLHEEVETNATQTNYLTLTGMKRGGTTAMSFGATNGTGAWTPEDGNGMAVAANGAVISATYTVDKDTPAGTYTISFSEGLFTYDINNEDVDEADEIASDATITVTRSDNNGGNNGDDNGGNNGNTGGDNGETGDDNGANPTTTDGDSEDDDDSGLGVPNTGKITGENNGANATILSIASFAAAAVLLVIGLQTKGHKKVNFDKQ